MIHGLAACPTNHAARFILWWGQSDTTRMLLGVVDEAPENEAVWGPLYCAGRASWSGGGGGGSSNKIVKRMDNNKHDCAKQADSSDQILMKCSTIVDVFARDTPCMTVENCASPTVVLRVTFPARNDALPIFRKTKKKKLKTKKKKQIHWVFAPQLIR